MKSKSNRTAEAREVASARTPISNPPHLPLAGSPEVGSDNCEALELLRAHVFRTTEGKSFVTFDTGRRLETMPIDSSVFREWLRLNVPGEKDKPPSNATVTSWINSLSAHALQKGPAETHVRVAFDGSYVHIDLADDHGRVVEITAEGWAVRERSSVAFVRPPDTLPLPQPKKGGSIELLRPLLNLTDNDFVLIVAWLLDALRNDGAHPILVINGPEGTAKSTLLEILRALIDPRSPLTGLPQSERQLLASAAYLRAYDNVSSISTKISDALCRLSTGRPAHPIIINGIGDLVPRADFADRCLFVSPDPISDKVRRLEQEVWAAFEAAQPEILGALFDAVAHGLRSMPTTKRDSLPRMAGFAHWATACEGPFWSPGTFMAAYRVNLTDAAEQLIETDLVASAVQRLAITRGRWIGTAAKLLVALQFVGNPKAPQSPRALSGQLRNVAPRLCQLGINVAFSKTGHAHERTVTIAYQPPEEAGPETPQAPSADGDDGQTVPNTDHGGQLPVAASGQAEFSPAEPMLVNNPTSDSCGLGTDGDGDILPVPLILADGADGADDYIGDERTTLVRSVLIEGRSIPVYRRPASSWTKRGQIECHADMVRIDALESDYRYDGDAAEMREAAKREIPDDNAGAN
jgi:hypothetical protein